MISVKLSRSLFASDLGLFCGYHDPDYWEFAQAPLSICNTSIVVCLSAGCEPRPPAVQQTKLFSKRSQANGSDRLTENWVFRFSKFRSLRPNLACW